MTRNPRPPAALVLAVLIAAGCSGSPAGGSAGSGGAAAGDTARAQAVRFSQCMRDNGVGEFPDPDASGELTIDAVANDASVDTGSAAFEGALEACKDLKPPGFTGTQRDAEQQRTALRFAQCIREHGVQDFPDPTPDSPLVDTNRIPSANTEGGMSILNAAMKACADAAAGLVRKP